MGKKVGSYELDKKIGEGNYGTVYVGKNSLTQEPIAGKSIPIKTPNKKLLQQMDAEIRVLKSSDCPYVIKLHDVLKTKNNVYLIMEYCAGGDLENYVRLKGKVEESIASRWLSQLVESFIHLQEKHIMHRDIKLANILLTAEDHTLADIRVADFGFARFLDENSFAATQLGTPLFMAPEIFHSESYSFKADVWSLGVLAYEILTGYPVFTCRTLAQLKQMQQEEVKFPEHLSETARGLVRDMLSYDQELRPSFQQLRGHEFFKSIYAGQEIKESTAAEKRGGGLEDIEDDDYEFPEGAEELEEIEELKEEEEEEEEEEKNEEENENHKDRDRDRDRDREEEGDLPLVRMEAQFGVLTGRTMDIDLMVEHMEEILKMYEGTQSKLVAKALLVFCNKKILGLYMEAGNIAAEYSLTRSKDVLFSDLYEKIQSMLFETADMLENDKTCVDNMELWAEVENLAKVGNGSLQGIRKSLNYLEVAVEIPECPEEIKQLQHEILLAHKDFIRRGYY